MASFASVSALGARSCVRFGALVVLWCLSRPYLTAIGSEAAIDLNPFVAGQWGSGAHLLGVKINQGWESRTTSCEPCCRVVGLEAFVFVQGVGHV